ncbi:hypothetical protein [Algoriphagus litoralis]|uniref:hypothetical protein n=1 Tax=Algoriphagus litoralis TaxID=2202829 RepID=UPI001300BD0A|nr:hypothetical protein [Algoriphagus litoralis]
MKVPFSDDFGRFLLLPSTQKDKKKNSAMDHFCSVADEIVRDLKMQFSANPNLEGPKAIFCMAHHLAYRQQAI